MLTLLLSLAVITLYKPGCVKEVDEGGARARAKVGRADMVVTLTCVQKNELIIKKNE
jgi:hypothetical protein